MTRLHQKILKSITLICFAMGLSSCGKYFSEGSRHDPVPETFEKPQTETLGFADIKSQVLDKYCISCHTGRHQVFENYQVVKASAGKILARINSPGPGRMPPLQEGLLPGLEKQLLTNWIESGAPETSNDSNTLPKPKVYISFQEVKDKVLKPNRCLTCHSQYKDYTTTRNDISQILGSILSKSMPFPAKPGGEALVVSEGQKEFLMKWINQGMAEYSDGSSYLKTTTELKPNWLSLRNQVLGPKCILCHNSFGLRSRGIDMSTYQALLGWAQTNPLLFNKEDPHESHFIGALIGRVDEDEFFFDPMPLNISADDVIKEIPPATKEEIKVIKEWIRLGLPYSEDDI